MTEKVAVIGLGYVGLPVALAFAKQFSGTLGFDVNVQRISDLRRGVDWTGETSSQELTTSTIKFTSTEDDLNDSTFYVVCVPTPIDSAHRPDLGVLRRASETVGRTIHAGAVVVYESTVYPGVTEEYCGPIIERISGLKQGRDFKLGYSPERINPGDKQHTLETIIKVVSGQDRESADRVASAYGAIIKAGLHRAPTIKVAEAAKVIENTQRDLNIALMNECALIFERLGICTADVLRAAATKWNFLKFTPGLVGGHCIGVDPYYLTAKAEAEGYRPEVILSGRRINDNMGAFIAGKLLRMMSRCDVPLSQLRVAILGLSFKENVRDLRNSRVPDVINELKNFGVHAKVVDPQVDSEQAHAEYGISLSPIDDLSDLHGLILAVPHREFIADPNLLFKMVRPKGALIDVKSAINPSAVPDTISFWSL